MLEGFARAVRGALVFGLVGPPVGYVTFLIILHLFGDDARLADMLHPLIAMGIVLAYWIGGIPAMATGVLAGLLRPWLGGWRDYFSIGVIGGLLAFGLALASGGSPNLSNVGTLLIPGVVGGAVSARLLCTGRTYTARELRAGSWK